MSDEPSPEMLILIDGVEQPAQRLPKQHEFQAAFTMSGGDTAPRVVVDMERALPIAQEMIRRARGVAFAANDAAFMSATQRRDTAAQQACIDRGQRLRDSTTDARLTSAKSAGALLAAVNAIIAEF